MGYDMHWRKADPNEAAAVAAAHAAWDETIRERDVIQHEKGTYNPERAKRDGLNFEDHAAHDGRTERYAAAYDKARAGYVAMLDAEASYFRLNMFSMGRFCDAMVTLGMVFEDAPRPEWPKPESWGVTYELIERVESPEYFSDEPPLDAETEERARRWITERDRVLMWHGKEIPGIPLHKFGSNDGWIVLPAEAEAALRIYMAKLKEIGQDAMNNLIDNEIGNRGRWAQWLAWLNGAVSHDGFEVH